MVEECLALPEWYSEIENIAKQMAMHFGEAGWYLGDQLKKGTAKDNKPGLYVVYEHESKPYRPISDIRSPSIRSNLRLERIRSKRSKTIRS